MNWIKTIIHALAASMTAKVFAMGLRFVTICLLPLWLAPAEIGWNAVILAIINFVIAIIDFGFGTALIKEKTCTVRMYQSVLTFILMISVVGSGAMISFADPIARVFSFPPFILVISAFAIPFSVFAIVPNALLQRELRFTSLAIRDLIGEIAFSATALLLAIFGYTWLCVPIALVVQRIIRWLVSTLSIQYVPGFALSWSDLRQLFSFSMYQLGNITIAQLANRLDTFLLSIFLTPSMLGFYSQGQQLSTIPVQSITGTATNVFFATFAKLQDDLEKFKTLFIKIVGVMFFVSLAIIGIAFPAMGLIPKVYSSAWQESVEIARNLCFSIPFFAFSAIEGILISVGGERRRLASSIARMAVMAIGICILFGLWSSEANPRNVAWIVLASSATGACMNFQYLWNKLALCSKDAHPWIKYAIAGACIAIIGIVVTRFWGL